MSSETIDKQGGEGLETHHILTYTLQSHARFSRKIFSFGIWNELLNISDHEYGSIACTMMIIMSCVCSFKL